MRNWFYLLLFVVNVMSVRSQNLEFSKPEKLGPEINSEDEELAPMLSPDGNTLYFARAFHNKNIGGKYAGTDIWISRKDSNGNWTPAVNAGKPWNNKRSNAVIGISRDHKTVYLLNAYNNKSGISYSKLINGKWTKPEFVPVPGINRDDFVSIYVHPDFAVMLISMKGSDSYGEEDLYVSLRDSLGNWSKPQNLGPTINTQRVEMSPFLSLSMEELFFSSDGHSGFGDVDVFYCSRLYDSWETWTIPKSLGQKLNSKDFDAYFTISSDSSAGLTLKLDESKSDVLISKITERVLEKNLIESIIFLSDSAVMDLVGFRIDLDIKYSSNSIDLKEEEKKTLNSISKFLVQNRQVNLQIVAPRVQNSKSLEINKNRLNGILYELKRNGVEGTRVTFGSEVIFEAESEKLNKVFFKFYYSN